MDPSPGRIVGAARLLVAAGLFACGSWIVLVARIGPVIARVTPGHGVHTGDALGMVALGLSLFVLVGRPDRGTSRSPRVAPVAARQVPG